MGFRVVTPGLHSLVVGRPRAGVRHQGLPTSGPADRAAWHLANLLVGNPPDATALELTLAGPTLDATADHDCALVGAPFDVRLNDRPVEPGGGFRVRAGDRLAVRGTPTGVRAVLAVRHGIQSPLRLGSHSAFTPITPGETLDAGPSAGPAVAVRLPESATGPLLGHPAGTLWVVPGPERDWFDESAFGTDFEVSPHSNRMGVRLVGECPGRVTDELRSSPVVLGTVQVPRGGSPIVLGVEGQTIGGYPRVAQVVRASWDAIGQLRPGDRVRLEPVTLERADDEWQRRQRRLADWRRRIALSR